MQGRGEKVRKLIFEKINSKRETRSQSKGEERSGAHTSHNQAWGFTSFNGARGKKRKKRETGCAATAKRNIGEWQPWTGDGKCQQGGSVHSETPEDWG